MVFLSNASGMVRWESNLSELKSAQDKNYYEKLEETFEMMVENF